MTEQLRINKMKAEDINRISDIILEENLDGFEELEWINKSIDDPFAYFFTAFYDDELVGYCGTYHNTTMEAYDFHYFKIGSVTVKKEYCRKGIGRALIIRAIDTARELGLDKIKLEVDTKSMAVKLYESLGFKVEKTERNFYDYGGDAYIMWRNE